MKKVHRFCCFMYFVGFFVDHLLTKCIYLEEISGCLQGVCVCDETSLLPWQLWPWQFV